MTKRTRPDFNKEVLHIALLQLQKHELFKIIEFFNMNELRDAIKTIYSQSNPQTNEKIEKYFVGEKRKRNAKDSINNS